MPKATRYIRPYQRKGRPGIISGLSQEGKITASGMINIAMVDFIIPLTVFHTPLHRTASLPGKYAIKFRKVWASINFQAIQFCGIEKPLFLPRFYGILSKGENNAKRQQI
jgi:hypothetical protein